ncbi:MAG TPA: hypothetical protein EYG39_03455, partial [Rhodothermales bacterium]|nr:hypothetical protein [Rhodothermales bacterium]
SLRWKPGTLWQEGCHDITQCVLAMLAALEPRERIVAMLDNLRGAASLSELDHGALTKLVLERTSTLHDVGAVDAAPNQSLVLTAGKVAEAKKTPEELERALESSVDKMSRLWSTSEGKYVLWHDLPHRRQPSQLTAFQSLRAQFEQKLPILVMIPSPAGFGKSELIAAWRYFTEGKKSLWETTSPTGVAATQVAGCTLHALIQLRSDGTSGLSANLERIKHFQQIAGFVIDEAFMLDDVAMCKLMEVSRQFPLREDLRRVRADLALPHWGFRDVILCGDLRQLPPASGNRPFWSTHVARNLFAVFVLTEDRRHERDAFMQTLKEKLAWGGSLPAPTQDPTRHWPVDGDVREFFLAAFLAGWGLTGAEVDLEVGTALFPLRKDCLRWNEACIQQIERRWGSECWGLDVHGHNWQQQLQPGANHRSTVRLAGIQTPEVLRLRSCPAHRQRLMCLRNVNVQAGWANGSRVRLFASEGWDKPWSGPRRPLRADAKGNYTAETLDLKEVANADFAVFCIRDHEQTLAKAAGRFAREDVQPITAHNDTGLHGHAWRQVQLALAYALSIHKGQGLTMNRIYGSLANIFSFGLVYTECTRTQFQRNIYMVGVPPRDLFAELLRPYRGSPTRVDHERHRLEALLADTSALEKEVAERLSVGDVPGLCGAANLEDPAVRKAVLEEIRAEYAERVRRLHVPAGILA